MLQTQLKVPRCHTYFLATPENKKFLLEAVSFVNKKIAVGFLLIRGAPEPETESNLKKTRTAFIYF